MANDTSNLTLKQRKWLKAYIECGNATEAAMRAYDCKTRRSANAIGAKNLSKINLGNALEDEGLTLLLIAKTLIDGCKATKMYGNGIARPDWRVRHPYLVTALRIRGLYPPTKNKKNNADEAPRILITG
ncbi:hypothetical protein A2773_01540 [Candidatus Gottesmanbacteria bacterium RIFCSPHIGHO2_01_FULL_39_10]|uniref:Terminase n=1 Tax=Candidatus Gottesmanbacteria bacterium RIFCSPHIGHO2_01_FULL_39_10 TaxID=1798375 RepID=A0A1F5ZMX9_9BACT|nr:MAG: hypothetical protein A2773_01540 [Candidatus Gottesmanbacteria bacterium RIFCSPHIGHO2_01_FULL_39_10]